MPRRGTVVRRPVAPDPKYNEKLVTKFVNSVMNRIRRYQFKRMMPPIAKLSNRTIGYDFLYLRDWGT